MNSIYSFEINVLTDAKFLAVRRLLVMLHKSLLT